MLVALRSQSCLRLEGRTRTLRGPSPEPSFTSALHFLRSRRRGPGRLSESPKLISVRKAYVFLAKQTFFALARLTGNGFSAR